MKKIPVILALVAVAVVAYSMTNWATTSNKTITASKNVTTETRSVGDFDKIEVEGVFEVDVTYSSKEKVSVEAPKNIQKLIELSVKSGTLHVELKNNTSVNTNGALKIHISTAKLNGFSTSGASSIKLNNSLKDDSFTLESSGAASFKGDVEVSDVEIELDGASTVELSGTASRANLRLSGASQMDDYDFSVKNLNVVLSGASSVTITSLKSLTGDVSGASSLDYRGDPSVKKLDVSGAASADGH